MSTTIESTISLTEVVEPVIEPAAPITTEVKALNFDDFVKVTDSEAPSTMAFIEERLVASISTNDVTVLDADKNFAPIKSISIEDFVSIIKNITTVEKAKAEKEVISGVLPPSNTIFFSQTKDQMCINVYHPGGVRPFRYTDSKSIKEIVVPNIIISFTLKKDKNDWIMASTYYFCTDLNVGKLPKTFINAIDHSKGIYLMPFTNMYDNGRMCFGDNHMPARYLENNLRGLDYYYKFLWETPFNNDLGLRAIGNSMGVSDWYNSLGQLAKDKGEFPYEKLSGYRAR